MFEQTYKDNMKRRSAANVNECAPTDNWTEIEFEPDLEKFDMSHLEEDSVSIMRKRVVEMSCNLSSSVRVQLDGKHLKCHSFQEYVELCLVSAEKLRPYPLHRIHFKIDDDKWEVYICVGENDMFQQVSFVNSIATVKGGTHVDYITNQIVDYVFKIARAEGFDNSITDQHVTDCLWIFLNAFIENPTFDSQHREALITEKIVSSPNLLDYLRSIYRNHVDFNLTKTDGKKVERIWVVDKLEDADHAGTDLSDDCTLILTKGDSATTFAPGTYSDHALPTITYKDFINQKLILFSRAHLKRAIPLRDDGLKSVQRKFTFCSFKRDLIEELSVAQLSGYVSEHSAYHHGGDDCGMPRYIYTKLNVIARYIFHKDDDQIINYLNEDGRSIKSSCYLPVIPFVLVNGGRGVGTGYSTSIPCYNPLEVIQNTKRLVKGLKPSKMHPFFKGFNGKIKETKKGCYSVRGIVDSKKDKSFRIKELPLGTWTWKYKKFLESISIENPAVKNPLIKCFKDRGDDKTVDILITMLDETKDLIKDDRKLFEKFKLKTSLSTKNMHLLDIDEKLKKYDDPEQIMADFYTFRLPYYHKRKKEAESLPKKEEAEEEEVSSDFKPILSEQQDLIEDLISLPLKACHFETANDLNAEILEKNQELENKEVSGFSSC